MHGLLRCQTRCTGATPAQVRTEFLHMIGDWMLRLRERCDHEGRLLPFVLAGLVDECPQVRARCCAGCGLPSLQADALCAPAAKTRGRRMAQVALSACPWCASARPA